MKWACPASLSEVRARSAEADRSFSTARPPTRETRREREASNRLGLFRKGSLFLTKGYFLLTTLRASIRFVARVGSHRIFMVLQWSGKTLEGFDEACLRSVSLHPPHFRSPLANQFRSGSSAEPCRSETEQPT